MNQQEFLDDIEGDICDLVDPYYVPLIDGTMQKIKDYLNAQRVDLLSQRVWFPFRRLPTPQIPLKLKLDTGEIIDGVRPSYIASYGESDLGYRDSADNILLNVVSWAIA